MTYACCNLLYLVSKVQRVAKVLKLQAILSETRSAPILTVLIHILALPTDFYFVTTQ